MVQVAQGTGLMGTPLSSTAGIGEVAEWLKAAVC